MKIFIAHSALDRGLVEGLTRILREEGHDVLGGADAVAAGNLLSVVSAAIRSVDVLIAVVRAESPNVFYELGLAAGATVPVLIAVPEGERVPSDLTSVSCVQLTGDTSRDARTILRRAEGLQRHLVRAPSLFQSAEATLQAANNDPALLESLDPVDFERLVMQLFEERGYTVTRSRAVNDLGVDFSIKSERDQVPILVQVKKLSKQSRVSVDTVRRVLAIASLLSPASCMLITTSDFTAAAAALTAGSPLMLVTLDELLAKKSEGKPTEARVEGNNTTG